MTLQVSWSSLQRYERCHQHHLRTMQRKAISRPQNMRDFLPGTVADRIQRAWLNSPDPQPGQMLAMVPDMLDRYTNPERNEPDFRPVKWKGDPRKDREEVVEFVSLVVTKLEPILLKWVIPYDYEPEKKFSTFTGIPYLDGRNVGIRLIGGIDIVVRLPDGSFILFDLKATKNDSYIAKTLGQGVFYDIAWKHYFKEGHPKRFGFIAPALDEQLIWADITPDDRRVMITRIIEFAHGMWREDWTPKVDNSGCEFCDTRHVCDKWTTHLVQGSGGQHQVDLSEVVASRRT